MNLISVLRKHTASKRRRLFKRFIDQFPKPVRVIDIGGTENFWLRLGVREEDGLDITLLNNHHIDKTQETAPIRSGFITDRRADARFLTEADLQEYDLVFSNSTIEHFATQDEQKALCDIIDRSGLPYFIQVPNKNALVDPHFPHPLVPFFARYPKTLQARLLTVGRFGSGSRSPNMGEALARLKYYTPIDRNWFRSLFPNGTLTVEWQALVPMSLVMTREP